MELIMDSATEAQASVEYDAFASTYDIETSCSIADIDFYRGNRSGGISQWISNVSLTSF